MNRFDARWARLACCGALVGLLMVLGGCSSEDDDDGGGGGGTSFPSIPTERPTLAGLNTILSAVGGDGATDSSGGVGGDITLNASYKTLRTDGGRDLPGIDDNLLTGAVLGDDVVTYTEMINIDPARVSTAGSTTVIDLDGLDFYLPASATLDLSGAPGGVDSVGIRATESEARIRIEGSVLGARLTEDAVSLMLFNEVAGGTAIGISGNIDLQGNTDNPNGGDLNVFAGEGNILFRGSVTTDGIEPTTGTGGDGGEISFVAARGHIMMSPGMFDAGGGAGAGSGAGGSGGDVDLITGETSSIGWGVRSNGGSGVPGGDGGQVSVVAASDLTVNVAVELNGGAGSNEGGSGGSFYASGYYTHGVVAGTLNGGAGSAQGGAGGGVTLEGDSVTGAAIDVIANGGDATLAAGGGGEASIYLDGAFGVNLLIEGEYLGGEAEDGGLGGSAEIAGYAALDNASIDVDVSGGDGTASGGGGDGGIVTVSGFVYYGDRLENVLINAVANGGDNGVAGAGGEVNFGVQGGLHHDVTAVLTLNGGDSDTDPGAGGVFRFPDPFSGSATGQVDFTLSGTAIGGSSSASGNGGDGGEVILDSAGVGGMLTFNTDGTLDLSGGDSVSGNGGTGGRFEATTGEEQAFVSQVLNLDLNGGDSELDAGGAGNEGPAFLVDANGPVTLQSGTVTANGGVGSTVSGDGLGGTSGTIMILTSRHAIAVGATLEANSGDGGGGGGLSGQGYAIGLDANSDDDDVAGSITVTGTLRSNGGNGTGTNASGGVGRDIELNTFSPNPLSGGEIVMSGMIETIGGDATGTGTGGPAFGVVVRSSGSRVEFSGSVVCRGGNGDTGGSLGGGFVAFGDVFTDVVISGSIELIAGDGTTTGGDSSPLVLIGAAGTNNPFATVTFSNGALLSSQAGNGGTTNGATGNIEINAQGTGGANVTIDAGATIEVLDGDGTSVPGAITID